MQPADNMIDSPAPDHAVLSQDSIQHLQDLLQAHPSTFDQTDHPADMLGPGHGAVGSGLVGVTAALRLPFWMAFLILPASPR